jgi:hypothetical protein
MSQLDEYQTALLATHPEASVDELLRAVDSSGPEFPSFIVDHGLGPEWHSRTNLEEFRDSRWAAEALFLAQEHALSEVGAALEGAGIEYALIKGGAVRLLVYSEPALRACHDLDLLVRPEDRVRAATVIAEAGFAAAPEANSISRELLLTRAEVNVDLHWALLREGRLRHDVTEAYLQRRQRHNGLWMLHADDALFVLLVHPAFTKHLAGWDMGLHRVADIVEWLRTQKSDWQKVCAALQQNGVQTAAWATLRWVQLLSGSNVHPDLDGMLSDIAPGRLRKAWLDRWLRKDLSTRTSGSHWLRLFGFSVFLHDAPGDSLRALVGRYRALRRSAADLAVFHELDGQ